MERSSSGVRLALTSVIADLAEASNAAQIATPRTEQNRARPARGSRKSLRQGAKS